MEFGQFVNLTDSWKLFIVEVNVADEIQDLAWIQHGTHTNLWYADYDVGFPNKIIEDGVAYTERFMLVEANSNAGSFYYDFEAQRLYIHTSGSDSPGKMTGDDYDYSVITFCWRNFGNSPATYTRLQEALNDGGFEEWTTVTDLTKWTEVVAGSSTVNREIGADNVAEGGFSVRLDVDGSNNNAGVYQDIVLQPGAKNRIQFDYKMSLVGKTAQVEIKDTGNNVYLNSSGNWQVAPTTISLSNKTSFYSYELTFYAYKSYTNYRITFSRLSAASSSIYFDNGRLTRYREDSYYHPFFQSADLPSIFQAVADFYVGAVRMQFGRLRFLNDGYWYPTIQNHLWHNKDIIVKYGEKNSDYEDLETVFSGRIKKPAVGDQFAELVVSDRKVLTYRDIPATKYWVSNYSNLEDDAEGLPIPIIYGAVENIAPICIDTTTYKYKPAFHELEDIVDVYKNGIALTSGTDYTKDLANGEFTLTASPGYAYITCDVKGKKCNILDGTYSTNIADILWDILTVYGEIDEEFLDKESFLDLKAGRTSAHHLYLDISSSILEIIRQVQASALFHLVPLGSGKLATKRYVIGTDATTPRLVDEDYKGFKIRLETSGVYKHVKLRYNKNPSDNKYSTVIRSASDVKWKYDEEDTLTLTTTLKLKGDAENLGDYYIALLRDPLQKASASIPTVGFKLIPSDKVILSKTKQTDDGLQTILDGVAFRIMELKKNIKTGKADIVSLEDLQAAGVTFCQVCNLCQVCVTAESGVCQVCYGCEKCDAGQCESCQSCYYCEKCNTGQCTSCESCNICQLCNTEQCGACQICVACEKCNTGECTVCQICVGCEKCDTCQNAQCTGCEICDTCQLCDTCQNAQCTICEVCNICQKCNICQNAECTSCQACDTCEKCDTCQNAECPACQSCYDCQKCNTCQNAQCTTCETCDICQKCDSGECTTCQVCNICQKCDAGECAACQTCVACEKCDAGLCTTCMDCNVCQKCNTGECTTCMSCVNCEKCDAGECTTCMLCDLCMKCITCEVCDKCESI